MGKRIVIALGGNALGNNLPEQMIAVKPKMYQELAGKRFWAELTGDEDFYIKIIGYMGTMPEKYVADYKESYNRAANRLVREFSNSFCREDGSIDWEKLVEFNSGD